MALVEFIDDQAPYLNAENLNNNFNELNTLVSSLKDKTTEWHPFTPRSIQLPANSWESLLDDNYRITLNKGLYMLLFRMNVTGSANDSNIVTFRSIVDGGEQNRTSIPIKLGYVTSGQILTPWRIGIDNTQIQVNIQGYSSGAFSTNSCAIQIIKID